MTVRAWYRVWAAALVGGSPALLFPIGALLISDLLGDPYPGTDDYSLSRSIEFYFSVVLPAALVAPVLLGAAIGLLQRHLAGRTVVFAGLLGTAIGAVIASLGFAVFGGGSSESDIIVGSMGVVVIGVANTSGMAIGARLRSRR